MSATESAETLVECDSDTCAETFQKGHGFKGHCSETCYMRRRGRKALNLLKHDHRFCHSDFTRLKEIERPTDEQLRHVEGQYSTEAVIGFQYPTKHAEIGEITAKAGTNDTVVTGIVCGNCGTTDHRDDFLRDLDIQTAAKRLRKRIRETRAEGQHKYDFDTKRFVEAWNEHKDWELAVGYAIS